jgi:hypothetical protein
MKFFTLSVTSFFPIVIHLKFPVINVNFRAAWQNIGLEEKEKGFLIVGDEVDVKIGWQILGSSPISNGLIS